MKWLKNKINIFIENNASTIVHICFGLQAGIAVVVVCAELLRQSK